MSLGQVQVQHVLIGSILMLYIFGDVYIIEDNFFYDDSSVFSYIFFVIMPTLCLLLPAASFHILPLACSSLLSTLLCCPF